MAKEVGLHVQRIFQSAGAVNVAVCLLPLPLNVWNVVHLSACVGVGVIAACVGAWLVACTVATLVVGDVDCAPGTCTAVVVAMVATVVVTAADSVVVA